MNKKVMVAMSGGVDSSVAAALLQQKGYTVVGATFKLYNKDVSGNSDEKRFSAMVSDAKSVAERLGIEHYVFDFEESFEKCVVDSFVKSYLEGKTPNPCIDCNRDIKFGQFLKKADELGIDYVATGHYANIIFDESKGKYLLKKADDPQKDQSYVLYNLTQEQMERILFPLGGYSKPEVRKIAEGLGFVNSNKAESQDICFVESGSYAEFIENYLPGAIEKGSFVDKTGKVLGKHKGIIYYTIGQRKGLGLSFEKPKYVVSKSVADNTVVLGDEEDLYSRGLIAVNVNLMFLDKLEKPIKIIAKTRYKQKEQKATLSYIENGEYLVEFDEPVRAVSPGQAVVFYDEDTVVGGGTILKAVK